MAARGKKKFGGVKFKFDESSVPKREEKKPPGGLDNKATLTVNGVEFHVYARDMTVIENLGRGAYGIVDRVRHEPSQSIMAVKKIRAQVNSTEDKRILMDMDVAMRSSDCQYTVEFYGALFQEGDVWICMEVMDTCLDKLYKNKLKPQEVYIPENILSRISFSIVSALRYLQTRLKVIHRDVKPSNVLANRDGKIKLCDFGISGQLVNSMAKTQDAGSRQYMAPERINPDNSGKGYDVKSDVWSFGITMVEIATNTYPYEKWHDMFQQLRQVVQGEAPTLPEDRFSGEIRDFIIKCLKKECTERPSYTRLLDHEFIKKHVEVGDQDVATFIAPIIGDAETLPH
ncbi:dual specificity mitogen-activated protein kinase kinase 6-like [Lytechinus pictus]|uniref:dual specificity mitogen-activated protein kinase kinase 6-like n=1 Tax=Lytechinus pictus TaxID=7653 RepID=UPI00240E2C97|nr:dual specificity mitogen-activated protein kinase kinase 6-like [Lytechinus pictus]